MLLKLLVKCIDDIYLIILTIVQNNASNNISDKMPKAKFKRKGVPEIPVPTKKSKYSEITNLDSSLSEKSLDISDDASSRILVSPEIPISTAVSELPGAKARRTLIDLPEELVCLILARLPVSSISNLELTCKHLQLVLVNAR